MGSDATKAAAALGLLGLNSSFDSISTVPLKRKQSSSSSTHIPDDSASTSSESISCICGFTYDDGFSIGCDSCYRWCHAACFGIVESHVPEEWLCWVCDPRHVDKERAVRLQKARQKAVSLQEAEKKRRVSPGVERRARRASAAANDGAAQFKRKRRPSLNVHPQTEDEHVDIDEPWTHSYLAINEDVVPHTETRDKLRRLATQWRGITAIDPDNSASLSTTPAVLYPESLPSMSQITLRPLRKSSFHPSFCAHTDPSIRPPSYAAHTTHPIASSDLITPFTSTIIPSATYLSDPLNAYAHLSMPKPFVHLVGPPVDLALDARLTGNEARFIRNGCRPNAVLRPVLCLREKLRSGYHASKGDPSGEEETLTFGIFALRDLQADEEVVLGWEWDDGSVIHHLPALINSPYIFPPTQLQRFRQQLMSMLHALSSTFTTCACGSKARDCALTRMAEFVDNQTPPTPSPSPPTAYLPDGATWDGDWDRKQRCLDSDEGHGQAMEVGGMRVDLGPLIGVERGFKTRERVPWSGGMTGVEMVPSSLPSHTPKLQALRVSQGAGITGLKEDIRGSGIEVARRTSITSKTASTTSSAQVRTKCKGEATNSHGSDNEGMSTTPIERARHRRRARISSSPQPDSPDNADREGRLPPKMRKGWIHKSYEMLRDKYLKGRAELPVGSIVYSSQDGKRSTAESEDRMDIDETCASREMPPPPLPASRITQSLTIASPSPVMDGPTSNDGPISPSVSFAKLSLLSPITSDPPLSSTSYHDSSPSEILSLDDNREQATDSCPTTSRSDDKQDMVTLLPNISCSGSPSIGAPLEMTSADFPPLTISSRRQDSAPHASAGVMQSPNLDISPAAIVVDARNDAVRGTSDPGHKQDTVHSELNIVDAVNSASVKQPSPLPEPPELSEPQVSLAPPPPPPTKVKMSLKDFALRKRKQRENETLKAVSSPEAPTVAFDGTANSKPDDESSQPAAVNVTNANTTKEALDTPKSVPGDMIHVVHPPSTQAEYRQTDKQEEMNERLSAADSLQAKFELIETTMPSAMVVTYDRRESPGTDPPSPRRKSYVPVGVTHSLSPHLKSVSRLTRSPSPMQMLARQISQEDGEIVSLPTPKAPRSYSPPTRPRSFHSSTFASYSTLPPTPVRRPLYPEPHRALHNTLATVRSLPSGPRALRAMRLPVYPPPPPQPSSRDSVRSVPRGPSADRERMEWDRERNWVGPSRGRGQRKQ